MSSPLPLRSPRESTTPSVRRTITQRHLTMSTPSLSVRHARPDISKTTRQVAAWKPTLASRTPSVRLENTPSQLVPSPLNPSVRCALSDSSKTSRRGAACVPWRRSVHHTSWSTQVTDTPQWTVVRPVRVHMRARAGVSRTT